MRASKAKSQADIEWENRTLCIDGNCIGVVGPNGTCKECGKRHPTFKATDPPDDSPAETVPESDQTQAADEAPFEESDSDDASPPTDSQAWDDPPLSDDDWENRQLCVDGNCIGVIGKDGLCKECGKPLK